MPFADKVSPFNAPNFDLFQPARLSDERGVVLGTPLDGARSYVPWIGLTTIRELALKHTDKVGLVDAGRLSLAEEHVAATEKLLAAANARIEELEATQSHIDGLMKAGFTPKRTTGRPRKDEN